MEKIILGATYVDRITRFSGVATGHVEYLSGCNQTLLVPPAVDNVLKEAQWFDDQRLVQDHSKIRIELVNGTTPGFDKMAPKR